MRIIIEVKKIHTYIKGGPFFHDFVYPQNGFFSLILERFLALYQGYDEKSYMPP